MYQLKTISLLLKMWFLNDMRSTDDNLLRPNWQQYQQINWTNFRCNVQCLPCKGWLRQYFLQIYLFTLYSTGACSSFASLVYQYITESNMDCLIASLYKLLVILQGWLIMYLVAFHCILLLLESINYTAVFEYFCGLWRGWTWKQHEVVAIIFDGVLTVAEDPQVSSIWYSMFEVLFNVWGDDSIIYKY